MFYDHYGAAATFLSTPFIPEPGKARPSAQSVRKVNGSVILRRRKALLARPRHDK